MLSGCNGREVPKEILNQGDIFDLVFGCWHESKSGMNLNNCHAVLLSQQLDQARLARALKALQLRHPRARARGVGAASGYAVLLETDATIPLFSLRGAAATANLDLEQALMRPFNFDTGPILACTVVSHAPEPTSLLILAGTHGVADGVGLQIAMSDLLAAYDADGPLPAVALPRPRGRWTTSLFQLHQARNGLGDVKIGAEEIEQLRGLEKRFPARDPNTVNQTFLDELDTDFQPVFEGVAIEILRLTKDETDEVLAASRLANTTVTGTVGAGVQFCVVKNLLLRGRVTETVSMGIDVNDRYRVHSEAADFADELGNFVSNPVLHNSIHPGFWECARDIRRFIASMLDTNSAFTDSIVNAGLSKEMLLLTSSMPAATAASLGGMVHCNFSSLGVLKRFGQYKSLEVLENYSAAHMGFLPLKVNVCTSGSSGCMTICVMVTKNVVPDARKLACDIRDDLRALLRHVPAVARHRRASFSQVQRLTAVDGTAAEANEATEFTAACMEKLEYDGVGDAPAADHQATVRPSRLTFRRTSDPAMYLPLNANRRLSLGTANVSTIFDYMAEKMEVLIEHNQVRVASSVKAPDGRAFLGDASGAFNCTTHCQLFLCCVLSTVCAGPLAAFPLYEEQLAQSGVFGFACGGKPFPCAAQSAALEKMYQFTFCLVMLLFLIPGFLFDVLGARHAAVAGALSSAVALLGIAAGIHMDTHAHPALQSGLVSVCYAVADLGGIVASFAAFGWLWHYPGSQAFIIGLSNATNQVSGMLALSFAALGRAGYTIADAMCMLAVVVAISGVLLFFTVPPVKDTMREAGRVLATNPAALDQGSVLLCAPGWFVKLKFKNMAGVLMLFPRMNFAMCAYQSCFLACFLSFSGSMASTYAVWFGKSDRVMLQNLFAAAMGSFGLVINPLAGLAMDRTSFERIFAVTIVFMYMFAAAMAIPTAPAQVVAILAASICFGIYVTISMKYAMLFAPTEHYGSMMGILGTASAAGAIVVLVVASFLPEEYGRFFLPCLLVITLTFFALNLLRQGTPSRPPKDMYG